MISEQYVDSVCLLSRACPDFFKRRGMHAENREKMQTDDCSFFIPHSSFIDLFIDHCKRPSTCPNVLRLIPEVYREEWAQEFLFQKIWVTERYVLHPIGYVQ
jgi:hypothetical protein